MFSRGGWGGRKDTQSGFKILGPHHMLSSFIRSTDDQDKCSTTGLHPQTSTASKTTAYFSRCWSLKKNELWSSKAL